MAIPMVMGAISGDRTGRTTPMPRRRIPRAVVSEVEQCGGALGLFGHVLMENRHGLIVDAQATVADGFAEREAATTMLSTHWRFAPPRHRTVGADKAYDTGDFVDQVREVDMTPHVAQNDTRRGGSAIDARTTRHAGYAMSQHARPRIERAFAWLKTIAGLRKVKLRGLTTVDALFIFASAAFNIKRIVTLRAAAA